MEYDVVIVGSGPASIFCALELTYHAKDKLRVAIIEQGRSLEERIKDKDILRGWGGAGLFADGKITLSTEIGGWLGSIIDTRRLKKLIEYVDKIWEKLSPESRCIGYDVDAVEGIMSRARRVHIRLVPYRVRHIGSDNTLLALKRAWDILSEWIDIYFEKRAERINYSNKEGGISIKTNAVSYTHLTLPTILLV